MLSSKHLRLTLLGLLVVTGCALRHPAWDGGADDTGDVPDADAASEGGVDVAETGADVDDAEVGADVSDADAGPDVDDADVPDAPNDVADADDADVGDVLADARDAADEGDAPADVSDAADASDAADVRDVVDASDAAMDVVDATMDAASEAGMDATMDAVVDARDATPEATSDAPADVAADVTYTMATVSPAATSACATAPALRNDLGAWVYTGNTAGGGLHDYSRGGCNLGGTDRNEQVYSLSLGETRRVYLAVESTQGGRGYNPVLYVSRSCDPRTSRVDGSRELEVACVDDVGTNRNPSMNLVLPAGNYRVFVDGDDLGGSLPDGQGTFRLLVRIEEPGTTGRVDVIPSGACPAWTSGGGSVAGTSGDDVSSAALVLPFRMRWYGADVMTYSVSSNGIVMLNPSPPSAEWRNQAVPGSVAPNGVLAAWWDDLITDSPGAGGVTSTVLGAAPNRVLAVRWNNVSRYNDLLTRATFEVRLYETTSVVEYHYCGFGLTGTYDRATIGVESVDGLDGVVYALDERRVSAGQILRFTPP